MEFILSALNDYEEVNQYEQDSSDDRLKQFLNRQKHKITATDSPPGAKDAYLG